jgi:hypothetical protein
MWSALHRLGKSGGKWWTIEYRIFYVLRPRAEEQTFYWLLCSNNTTHSMIHSERSTWCFSVDQHKVPFYSMVAIYFLSLKLVTLFTVTRPNIPNSLCLLLDFHFIIRKRPLYCQDLPTKIYDSNKCFKNYPIQELLCGYYWVSTMVTVFN